MIDTLGWTLPTVNSVINKWEVGITATGQDTVLYVDDIELSNQPLPVDKDHLTISNAEIIQDHFGIPHIYGEDDESVMYAFGWAQAENHIELMSLFYLESNALLAESFDRTK